MINKEFKQNALVIIIMQNLNMLLDSNCNETII